MSFLKRVMHVALCAVAFATVGLTTAVAADMPQRPVYKAPATPSQLFDWSGLYVGANVSYIMQDVNSSLTFGNTTITGNTSPNDVMFGGHVALLKQYTNNVVFGGQFTLLGGSLKDTNGVGGVPAGVATKSDRVNLLGLLEAKLGLALYPDSAMFQSILPYVTAGAACEQARANITITGLGGEDSSKYTTCGWTVGAGVSVASSIPNVTFDLKYNYMDFANVNPSYPIPGAGGIGGSHPSSSKANAITAGISVKM